MIHQSVYTQELDSLSASSYIIVKGARVNNLQNLSVAIPRNQLVVITGLSGSGKSSLAFDTLFAEGQRMYVESLSTYARQFLGRMEKPAVDYIRGVSPAIAIEQKAHTSNPRSTVGTATEIYDYLKLLYARIGVTYSPVSGQPVKRDSVTDVVDYVYSYGEGTKVMILYSLELGEGEGLLERLKVTLGKGFTRVMQGGQVWFIEDVIQGQGSIDLQQPVEVLIDRLAVDRMVQEQRHRLADSIQTAFFEGHGTCLVEIVGKGRETFSDRFERDGMVFELPSVDFFNFNGPYGACKTCDGFGKVLGIDPDKVIPDTALAIDEGAILPWRSGAMRPWLAPLLAHGDAWDFPIHRPYQDLTPAQKQLVWTGREDFSGLHAFFDRLAAQAHKVQYRVLLSRYRGKTTCPDCGGARIRKDATYVRVGGQSIATLLLKPIEELAEFFDRLVLRSHEQRLAERLLTEIRSRLHYVVQVGLGYLALNRLTATLSGGEYQRIKLATALGSTLVGTMYILDEPTIGLHPRDTHRLVDILVSLKKRGNTVIVVEHDEAMMRAADQLIDIGPEAGSGGGKLVFQGDWAALQRASQGYTAHYFRGLAKIPLPAQRREVRDTLTIRGAREHNLKNIDVQIPLGLLTAVTGVSGSGKSTLVSKIIYPALANQLGITAETPGKYDGLAGDFKQVQHLVFVDQNPIGRSSRSNPITYVKAYDGIRQLLAAQPLAIQRGYQPSHFSFNIVGGRCEACEGEGETRIAMQFMADISLTCEQCGGKRFKEETLEITYRGRHVADILAMTVDEALGFFEEQPAILGKLRPLQAVGLGYMRLGQSSNSLSGGEAQRVKLAAYLGKGGEHKHTLFIFDEPTTGLHIHDIGKLLRSINALVDAGNSALVIEHNVELIKCADWIIDLGPGGGERGGEVVFSGTPEQMVQLQDNYTAEYLKEKLGGSACSLGEVRRAQGRSGGPSRGGPQAEEGGAGAGEDGRMLPWRRVYTFRTFWPPHRRDV
ncbi:MAG: excinuclease ABC subunit UvrA, partial [Bacteroidota bacterium]